MASRRRTLGSVYKRKPSGIYYIRFWHRGLEHRESARTTAKDVALALLDKRRREVQMGTLSSQAPEHVTFEDLIRLIEADYVTNGRRSLDSLRFRLKRLRTAFGSTLPVDITHKRLKEYLAGRLSEGASAATVRYELVALGRMFKLAVQEGMLSAIPLLPTVRLDNVRKGFFEAKEVVRVLEHLPRDIGAVIAFAYATGWRIGEIRGLTWAQVDLRTGVVRLEPGTTKNDEGRTFPFREHPALARVLEEQWAHTEALQREQGRIIPWVFHCGGEPIGLFTKTWRRACRLAGCPGKLVHDLRRTAVRNLERAAVPRSWAMKLTGHKTESIYRRYAIVSEADLAEGVRKLAARRRA